MTRGASALLQDSPGWLVHLDAQQEPSSNTCWDQERLRQHSESKALAEEQSHCQAIARDPVTGVLAGGSDPRVEGLALGF